MRIEQQNMFTGEFEVVRDDIADAEFKARMHQLFLEPFECPACEEEFIQPKWGEHYDMEEDKVYEYYFHHCCHCGFEEYVDRRNIDITPIFQKQARRAKERQEYEKLYERRLV